MHRGMHRTSFFVRSLMLVAAVCLCLTQVVSAAALKLSGSTTIEGSVESFKADPTGMYAVYVAGLPAISTTSFSIPNLYSVRLSGGAPVKLSEFGYSTDPQITRVSYEISPDGKWVVFTCNYYSWLTKVFVVPIQGGVKPINLNPSNMNVLSFAISPDSRWVVFSVLADGYHADMFHLYRAPLDGSGPAVEIKASDGSALLAKSIKFTPDSRRLLFEGGLLDPSTWGVYSMPVEDTGSQLVCVTKLMANRWVFSYTVTPDSQYVVYEFLSSTNGQEKGIYTVPVAGPVEQNLKVSGDHPLSASYEVIGLDPGGRRLVFLVDEFGVYMSPRTLYSTSLARSGSGAPNPLIQLNGPLTAGTVVKWDGVVISPDGAMVAYEAEGTENLDLYLAPINGPASSSVMINHADGILTNGTWHLPQFSPDSQRLVFVAQRDTLGHFDLYSVPTTGGLVPGQAPAVTRLSLPITATPLNGDATVSYPVITQDSQTVYYAAETQRGRTDLFRVPSAGPASASHNMTSFSVDGTWVSNLAVVPHQRRLLYTQRVGWGDGELYLSEILPSMIYLPAMRR